MEQARRGTGRIVRPSGRLTCTKKQRRWQTRLTQTAPGRICKRFERADRRTRLRFLNMPGIRFTLSHKKGPLAGSGQDSVEFNISTNPGEEPKPLAKIASGGELSRIMLAIKSALADKDDIGTVIYDEIDTGVSGLAAGRIGDKAEADGAGQTGHLHHTYCADRGAGR